MTWVHARYSKMNKGQFKIQQMVFIIVAIIILFGIVSVFFVSIRFSSLRGDVEDLRKDAVLSQVRKIAGTPEFNWIASDDCSSCIDLDKVFLLKERNTYNGFWTDTSLLRVSRVYPLHENEECTTESYPRCNQITLVNSGNFEAYESFVSLCRFDQDIKQNKCEIGKILMGFDSVR
ncbi:MAG: hypothetical protein AABW71_00875 [Nanoarchaeota archaeon]